MQLSIVLLSVLLLVAPIVTALTQPTEQELIANDARVLQYALLLEQLEAYFYTTYQAKFSQSDFTNAGLTANDYSYFNMIMNHEQAHVQFLEQFVQPPTSGNCTYKFNVNSVSDYIQTARILENTGVSAYDGALNNIYSSVFAEAAATIATIEARHASYLNKLNAQSPFPSAFDTAENSSTIATAVFGPNGFASCPLLPGFVLPQLQIVYPVANASDNNQPTLTTLTVNDVNVLQYALFLEHLEAAYYAYVISNFNTSEFATGVFGYLGTIAQHESTHVTALNQTIFNMGVSPIPACTYDFSKVNTSAAVLNTAVALEETGVSAYDGAVNAIYNYALKEIAATIATVEARHASFVNLAAGTSQGPVQGQGNNGAFDKTLNFTQVYQAVTNTNFLVNCPVIPVQFNVYTVQPYTNATINHAPTTAPTAAPTAGPTSTPTAAPTTSPTSIPTNAPATTVRATSTTARATSDATIASASVVVALLVAAAVL